MRSNSRHDYAWHQNLNSKQVLNGTSKSSKQTTQAALQGAQQRCKESSDATARIDRSPVAAPIAAAPSPVAGGAPSAGRSTPPMAVPPRGTLAAAAAPTTIPAPAPGAHLFVNKSPERAQRPTTHSPQPRMRVPVCSQVCHASGGKQGALVSAILHQSVQSQVWHEARWRGRLRTRRRGRQSRPGCWAGGPRGTRRPRAP